MGIFLRKMRVTISILIFLCLICLPIFAVCENSVFTKEEQAYIKENPMVKTAVDPLFVPFEFIDSDGNYKGIAADYLKLIEIKTGLTFEILEDLTWPEAYDLALAGQVDLLPCVGATQERQDNFLLTDSYLKYQRTVLSLLDGPAYQFKDLDKISVGVQRNSSNYSFLVFERGLDPVLYDDLKSLLTALSHGEIDAAVANYANAKYTSNELGITNIKAGEILDNDTSELTMAVNRNNPILASILDKALDQISEEERILITNKWLGIEREPDYSKIYLYIIIGLIVSALVIIFFVYWNRMLKRNAEERKEAEQKIKLLLESVGEGIIGVNTEGKVNFINSKATELIKYKDSDILGQSIHQKIHHKHLDLKPYDIKSCPIYKTYTFGETQNIRNEVFWRSDNSFFDVEYTSVPMYRDDQIEGAVIVFKDITTVKQQRKEIEHALEKVEKLYTSSLALTSTTNLNEVLNVILKSLKEVVPFNTATVQEFKNNEFKIIYCDGFDDPKKVIGQTFEMGKGTLNETALNKESAVVIPDVRKYKGFLDLSEGKKIRSFMAVPLAINDAIIGELTLDSHILGYYNDDMAETAEAFAAQAAIALNNAKNFEELEKAKKVAELAAKTKGDFLANMSHEIRTPMNAIIGLLSLMTYTSLTPKQADYVNKIDNASKNLLNIINDILDFSKIESGKLNVEQIEFNLDEVLLHISDVLLLKVEAKNIEFIISKGPKVPYGLVGDPLRLEQILLNLTSNAIKFTEDGEVIVEIKVIKQTKKNTILKFSVIDTGIGMTQAQVKKLFSAFVQADTSTTRKYGGTGLGLTISKNLVELMGGKIGVKSEYGKGSTFYFTCPFMLSAPGQTSKRTIPSEIDNISILVVDDNAYAREVIENYIMRFGAQVALVSSGEEALEEAKINDFDLFLIDYKMPGMNGIETWMKLKRGINGDKKAKAILITSYTKQELYDEAKAAQFYNVLSKPITQSTLLDSIIGTLSLEKEETAIPTKTRNYPKGFKKTRDARILVVEDNEINQQVIKELLETEGFWVELADNGQKAVDRIEKQNDFDLIFMDLQMPMMDGYTTARVLREKYQLEIPIIALSADSMESTEKAAKDAGMDDYISKPIDIQALFNILVQYIKPKKRGINKSSTERRFDLSEETLTQNLSAFDVGDGLARFGGNTALYLNTLIKFVKNNEHFIEELRLLLGQGEVEESKKLLHSLKGVSGNIGAVKLNRLIKELETELNKKDLGEINYQEMVAKMNHEVVLLSAQVNTLDAAIQNEHKTEETTETITSTEMASQLKALKKLLNQYDTKAKEVFEDLKHVDFGPYSDAFKALGVLIESYDFESGAKACGELIKQIEARDEQDGR